jgi:hypothetical protein
MAWFAVGVKKAQSGLDDFLPEVKMLFIHVYFEGA